jgi:hypothetical protein
MDTNNIKTYKIMINPDDNNPTSVSAIALTDDPAIEVNFIAFNNDYKELKFAIEDVKQMVSGPLLIPNKTILRFDEEIGYFNVVFDEETIEIASKKFFKNGYHTNLNENHTNTFIKNAYMFESWIITDPANDKSNALGFKGLPKGTWFGTFYIEDKEYFHNEILSGNFKGFSVEGLMGFQLNKIDMDNNKQNNINNMDNKINEFMKVVTTEGATLEVSELEIGATVTNEDGSSVENGQYDYVMDEVSYIMVIEDGMIKDILTKVDEVEVETEVEMSTEETDVNETEVKIELTEDKVNELISIKFSELNEIIEGLNTKIMELENKLNDKEVKTETFSAVTEQVDSVTDVNDELPTSVKRFNKTLDNLIELKKTLAKKK